MKVRRLQRWGVVGGGGGGCARDAGAAGGLEDDGLLIVRPARRAEACRTRSEACARGSSVIAGKGRVESCGDDDQEEVPTATRSTSTRHAPTATGPFSFGVPF